MAVRDVVVISEERLPARKRLWHQLEWCESWAWGHPDDACDGCAREGAVLAQELGEHDRAAALWSRVLQLEIGSGSRPQT